MYAEPFQDAGLFQEAAEPWLLKNEDKHCTVLKLIGRLVESQLSNPTMFMTVIRNKKGSIVGAAAQYSSWHGLQISIQKLSNSDMQDAVRALFNHIRDKNVSIQMAFSSTPVVNAMVEVLGPDEGVGQCAVSTFKSIMACKKPKKPKTLAPGSVIRPRPEEAEAYTDSLYVQGLIEFGDDSPTITQCRESLDIASAGKLLFCLSYRDHVVSMASVKYISPTAVLFVQIVTPTAYQNRGFQQALVYHTMVQLKSEGVATFLVEVVNTSPVAMQFFDSLGFKTLFTGEECVVEQQSLRMPRRSSYRVKRTSMDRLNSRRSQMSGTSALETIPDSGDDSDMPPTPTSHRFSRQKKMSRKRRGSDDNNSSIATENQPYSFRNATSPLPTFSESNYGEEPKKSVHDLQADGSVDLDSLRVSFDDRTGLLPPPPPPPLSNTDSVSAFGDIEETKVDDVKLEVSDDNHETHEEDDNEQHENEQDSNGKEHEQEEDALSDLSDLGE